MSGWVVGESSKQCKTIVLKKGREAKMAMVSVGRSSVGNALSIKLTEKVRDALHLAEEDDEVSVIILRSTGGNFCTGVDFLGFRLCSDGTAQGLPICY
ncbi:MAG: hypothetical protein J7K77_01265 [Dehalococcoidales bacterium]|nr:hypothetical protein [Dehalococcoidales bacterium]